jgi:hypothetical protein
VDVDKSGLETSVLGLWFKVRDKHFKQGDLKLKCTATIATIYWKSNEESVQGVRPQSALVSESRSSRNSGTVHYIQNIEIHNYIWYRFMELLMILSIGLCDQFSSDSLAILQTTNLRVCPDTVIIW